MNLPYGKMHMFMPTPDVTVGELAQILRVIKFLFTPEQFAGFPPEMARHFEEWYPPIPKVEFNDAKEVSKNNTGDGAGTVPTTPEGEGCPG